VSTELTAVKPEFSNGELAVVFRIDAPEDAHASALEENDAR
jgi:hypothetical protein